MRSRNIAFYLRKVSQGILVSLVLAGALFIPGRDVLVAQLLLYETMPNYSITGIIIPAFGFEQAAVPEDNLTADSIITLTPQVDIIGLTDDIYQSDAKSEPTERTPSEALTEADFETLADVSGLKSRFYTVDKSTDMTAEDFDVEAFMSAELTIDRDNPGPKVLVFHTHSTELYADSVDESEGVVGLGGELCRVLGEKYGIEALHVTSRFDIVDGKSQILGAYERMEPEIARVLADNPSIELVLDIHRDGVKGDRRLVTDIAGKPTAQLMFVNGLSKLYRDGVLTEIEGLPNPNKKANLAMSFRTQLAANALYPGLMRRVYINAYRYSLHMLPKSLLVEVGAQTNTKAEAFNAIEPLADVLAAVVLE